MTRCEASAICDASPEECLDILCDTVVAYSGKSMCQLRSIGVHTHEHVSSVGDRLGIGCIL
jgi:hypothetical protein